MWAYWVKENKKISDKKLFGSENVINCFLFKLLFFIGLLGPKGLEKIRETCRKNVHQFSSKTLRRIPSYDQKP